MRCVSIDFHTSPLIPDVGARFDKKKFADTYKAANAEQVLVFAKCHHGYTYYPTKVGTMNPNLDFGKAKQRIVESMVCSMNIRIALMMPITVC